MIREGNKWDTPAIIDMLRDYRSATPWSRLAECNNELHIRTLLAHIFAGQGVVFIAEKEQEAVGMLIAIKNSNIWDPELLVMNELAYWVDPEYRGSTSGYRLLAAYKEYCDRLKSQGLLEAYTISKMVNSPDLDYARFGFEKLEETWRN
jgi:N-acetylglutamate synthase-like GNAT family acetyltransferase